MHLPLLRAMLRISIGFSLCTLAACSSSNKTDSIPANTSCPECATVPKSPVCYAPCAPGTRLTGNTQCPSNGLVSGCLSGTTCNNGSCVAAGQSPPACNDDLGCPDYQACIQGNCYSNCAQKSDCSNERICHRAVCRPTCSTTSNTCTQGTHCATQDGDVGVCMPSTRAVASAQSALLSDSDFSLSESQLPFTHVQPTGSFIIYNNSNNDGQFTVSKTSFTRYSDSGPETLTTSPLAFLTLGTTTSPTGVATLTFTIPEGASQTIYFAAADTAQDDTGKSLDRWTGLITVARAGTGTQKLSLGYTASPDGQWAGELYYFATFNDVGLAAWKNASAGSDKDAALGGVANALFQQWEQLRKGSISIDRFNAMLTSTKTGSWSWTSTQTGCSSDPGSKARCYPYNNPSGIEPYTNDFTQYPIPSGMVEFKYSMNLQQKTVGCTAGLCLAGRINTNDTLHYPGNPAVNIELAQAYNACVERAGNTICDIQGLNATIKVGGRYKTTDSDTSCTDAPKLGGTATFAQAIVPWLVPGFIQDTDLNSSTLTRSMAECRDKMLPSGLAGDTAQNLLFARSNPIPDGKPRIRTLTAIDGIIVNAHTMLVLFREHFGSFLGTNDPDGFSAYGVMVLTHQPIQLATNDVIGANTTDLRTFPTGTSLAATCDQNYVNQLLRTYLGLSTTQHVSIVDNANIIAQTMLNGVVPSPTTPTALTSGVHYYCEDTGLIDGGKDDDGTDTALQIPCPGGSRVQYFAVTGPSQDDIAKLPCQRDYAPGRTPGIISNRGSCQQTITEWQGNDAYAIVMDPVWKCTDDTAAYCSNDRSDLRTGKTFYAADQTTAVLLPLRAEIDSAFRYATRFRSRTGQQVGFSPQICIPNSDQIPYCYDPDQIFEVKQRVDCLADLYINYKTQLNTDTQEAVRQYLLLNYGHVEIPANPLPLVYLGFEPLYAQLLITLGDDAYTEAFASRFDLAGSSELSFPGSLFETGGLDLSGGAGYEMYVLYQATQYYQMVLDRFFEQSNALWTAITASSESSFVGLNTITDYLDKVIRASTQKTRAFSEIATHYQKFNKPHLARAVIQSAYGGAYLESIVISRFVLEMFQPQGNVLPVLQPSERPQAIVELEQAQLTYRSALLNMRDIYDGLTDQQTIFGFAPDYIPFPALESNETDAFLKVFASARSKAAVAATKEDIALADNRSFDTDAAAFQSELVSIRNNYEDQLAALCGTLIGSDGLVYPAITKYASLNAQASVLGDPCGLASGGTLRQAMTQVDVARTDIQQVQTRFTNLQASLAIEQQRVTAYCGINQAVIDYQDNQGDKVTKLQDLIDNASEEVDASERSLQIAGEVANLAKCSIIAGTADGGDCPEAAIAGSIYSAASAGLETESLENDIKAGTLRTQISDIQGATTDWVQGKQCDYAQNDSNARLKTMTLDFATINLDSLEKRIALTAAVNQVASLHNQASRLQTEQTEAEQMAINVEAAKDDPNVRIYKNDSILTSDRTFQAAIKEAYRATLLYQYQTAQSYEHMDDLFLVRMVQHGDLSLDAYLDALQDAYYAFGEQFGTPDLRVMTLSLRNDILKIPRLGAGNIPLTEQQRISQLQAAMVNPANLDKRGFITFQFPTTLETFSPVTGAHQVVYVQAEILGSNIGDDLGRVYLSQHGTGTMRAPDGTKNYYILPKRSAVINPFFNGSRVFDSASTSSLGSIYTNHHLQGRPLANTQWSMALNTVDETANLDIAPGSIADIRLYFFYTDITTLDNQ